MPSFGLAEILILLVCCGIIFLTLATGVGAVFALMRWGVIGSYWIKGETPPQEDGDYSLDQSRNVAD